MLLSQMLIMRPKVRADAKMSSCGAVFTVNCFERHGKHWDKCY